MIGNNTIFYRKQYSWIKKQEKIQKELYKCINSDSSGEEIQAQATMLDTAS